MEINLYLLLSLLIALLVISYLLGKLHRVRGQLFLIRDVRIFRSIFFALVDKLRAKS